MFKVTTSWDDGDALDKKLANLLTQYNIKGTFYPAKLYRPNHLSDEEIKDISILHEIGAHTLTHPNLRILSEKIRKDEIEGSKQWLEKITDSGIKMFCYPKGLYDNAVVSAVKKANFIGARTTQLGVIVSPSDPFLSHTTIQVYPFPFRKIDKKHYYWKKILEPFWQRSPELKSLNIPTLSMYSWLSMAKATFDTAFSNGEIFHLWGHSWEIEKYEMWGELEKFFQYIKEKKGCVYLTNSEVIK